MDAIDYRLTDPHLDPFDSAEGHSSKGSDDWNPEQPIRLPDTFWCYDPATMTGEANPDSDASPLPALSAGVITFGCLNKFCKVNETVLALWARVLFAVPQSRLILLAPQGSARQRTLGVLGQSGVDSARIEFVERLSPEAYLAQYSRIDIGLDTFPYNGHTTSLDALWMGVPVVTLVGNTLVGRAGLSQLTNLNLNDLVALSEDEYVRIAVNLATDLPRLNELRMGLRQRMRESPLTDVARFARNLESAYREMWRNWCRRGEVEMKVD
jgi:predicted O-linked N-acetylglucosamine transferase (SPINDLY family)